jgi:hypothetical protein
MRCAARGTLTCHVPSVLLSLTACQIPVRWLLRKPMLERVCTRDGSTSTACNYSTSNANRMTRSKGDHRAHASAIPAACLMWQPGTLRGASGWCHPAPKGRMSAGTQATQRSWHITTLGKRQQGLWACNVRLTSLNIRTRCMQHGMRAADIRRQSTRLSQYVCAYACSRGREALASRQERAQPDSQCRGTCSKL